MMLRNRFIILLLCVLSAPSMSTTGRADDHNSPLRIHAVSGAVSVKHVAGAPASTAPPTRQVTKTTPTKQMAGVTVVGDNASDPFIIVSIPFSGAGSTVALTDDYDESCPYPQNGAPDAVYRYTPASNQIISIDLCASSYDTKVYVYEGSVTPGSPYACNDDYCGTSYLRSYIPSLPVDAGIPYFIVVDGYGISSGSYTIDIATDDACVWTGCVPGATPEAEVCAAGTDVSNGGCNTPSENFDPISIGEAVCGLIWAEHPNRDTDWYRTTLSAGVTVRWTTRAEFPFSVFVFSLAGGCGSLQGLRIDGDPCEELYVEVEPEASGDFAFVVTTREQFGGYTCATGPWQYEATLTNACVCECHADPAETPSPGMCDGVYNAMDIVTMVNIAFRGATTILDPSATCPWQRCDVDCNNVVNAIDLIKLVNVTFRGQPSSEQFTNPCAVP